MKRFNELYESILNEVFNTKLNVKKIEFRKRQFYKYEVELKDNEYPIYPQMEFEYIGGGTWEVLEIGEARVTLTTTPKFNIWTAFDILNNVDIMKIPDYLKNGSKRDRNEWVWNIKDKFNVTDIGNATISMIDKFLDDEKPEHLKMNIRDIGGNNNLLKLFKNVAKKYKKELSSKDYEISFEANTLNITKVINK